MTLFCLFLGVTVVHKLSVMMNFFSRMRFPSACRGMILNLFCDLYLMATIINLVCFPTDQGRSQLRMIAAGPVSSDKSIMTDSPDTSSRSTWTGGWYGDVDGMRRLEARAVAAEVSTK